MAGRSGWQYKVPKCQRCGRVGAMYSVYSDRNVCPTCLSFERTVANAQAAADAAELEGVLQAEYRDAYDTTRDLRAGAVQ